jgi:hypothetical protein
MLPRIGSSKLVSTWIFVTLGASIVSMLHAGWLAGWTALEPRAIWHGQVWRIVTWPLVEVGPYALVMTLVSIYKFGGELAPRWGDRRLRRFALHLVIAAGVITALGALVSSRAWGMSHSGGWAIGEGLVIAWARQYPTAQLRLWHVLVLRGEQLIWVTAGFAVVLALANGPFVMAPELVCCLGAACYPRAWLTPLVTDF